MSQPYNRENELKERFNQFITDKITGINKDYYSRMSIEDLEELKTTLKDIHNIITYQTTVRFLDWLSERFSYVKDNHQDYLDLILRTKPNNNGYDIIVTGEINIIAEIKCNKPINNGYQFGPAQRNGIIKDIKGLLEGKSSARSIDPSDAYKFLAIYDFGDHTLNAVQHLIKNLKPDLKDKVVIFDEVSPLTKDQVNIVFIK